MGLNWSEGLGRLAGSLDRLGQYYSRLDEQEWQERRDLANQAFQERLTGLSQKHAETMQEKGFEQQTSLQAQSQEFQGTENDKTRQAAKEAADRQYNLSLQQLEVAKKSVTDPNEAKKLKGLELALTASSGPIQSLQAQQQAELKALDKDTTLSLDSAAMTAARDKINARYSEQMAPLIAEQQTRVQDILDFTGASEVMEPTAKAKDQSLDEAMSSPDAGFTSAQPQASAAPETTAAPAQAAEPAKSEAKPPASVAIEAAMNHKPNITDEQLKIYLRQNGYSPEEINAALSSRLSVDDTKPWTG